MTIDPVELERLSKALAVVIEAAEPMRLKEQADCLLGTKHRNPIQKAIETLRTGQLVPAQPSGDVVEAVARAVAEKLPATVIVDHNFVMGQSADPIEVVPYNPIITAAITTYEAVSGVAKMREALKKAESALAEAEGRMRMATETAQTYLRNLYDAGDRLAKAEGQVIAEVVAWLRWGTRKPLLLDPDEYEEIATALETGEWRK